jgi:hypothetical protein
MNDSKTAHRFKNKESERRSTRSRTDDPLDADKASHPRRGRRRRIPTRRARRARPTRGSVTGSDTFSIPNEVRPRYEGSTRCCPYLETADIP